MRKMSDLIFTATGKAGVLYPSRPEGQFFRVSRLALSAARNMMPTTDFIAIVKTVFWYHRAPRAHFWSRSAASVARIKAI
jgi:hypothetical protein